VGALLLLAAAVATSPPIDYSHPESWLCRPGREEICTDDVAITIVDRHGRVKPGKPVANKVPPADCFYVYPTASLDPTPNSDTDPGREERGITVAQLAPFRGVCRLFAPVYRQVTLTALRTMMRGGGDTADHELPYADVRAAWRDYLARDNGGRPVVLIGHSQGSMILKRLISEEIDGKPAQSLLVSAILPGATVHVPRGRDVGGDLKAIPLCRSQAQTGCVLTWASYRDVPGPPTGALFGRSIEAGMEAGCTNPAQLAGGVAPLDPILGFPWWRGGVAQYRPPATGWSIAGRPQPTRFVRMPGLLSAQCETRGATSYLAVHVAPGVAAGPAEQLVGTAAVGDADYPEWGFHVIDMAIVEGDLVRLVGHQTKAWLQRGPATGK